MISDTSNSQLQNQLAKLAATVPGVIYSFRLRLDGSMCIPFASGALIGLLGLAPEDVRHDASPIFSLIHPEDIGRVCQTIADSAGKMRSWHAEFRVRRADGSEIWIEGHSEPHREPDGSTLWHGFIQDITERKQAERHQAGLLKRLESVNRLQEDLLLPGTLPNKLKKITDTAVGLLDLDFCRVWTIGPGDLCNRGCVHATAVDQRRACRRRESCLHLIASSGRYTHTDGHHCRVPLGCYKIGRIAANDAREFLTNSVTTDPQIADHAWAKQLGLVSFAGYRLHDAADATIGVLASFSKHLISEEGHAFLANLAEITSKVILESAADEELREQRRQADAVNRELEKEFARRQQMECELAEARKLEAIGHLAAGIAHEINTPTQYIGDNARFLQDAFGSVDLVLCGLRRLFDVAQDGRVPSDLLAEVKQSWQTADLDYLADEVPKAIRETLDGVERVATIVRAMKEFSHPGDRRRRHIDLNRAVESTLAVSRNEWKYVAEVVLDLDPSMPLVPGFPCELNQAILNVLINASQAIAEVGGADPQAKGTITVHTRRDGNWAEVRVQDTGPGIAEHVRSRVFEPFFTTKEVGKGTGQGLAIAYNTVVNKHQGTIEFVTMPGMGTTFIIRLPILNLSPESEHAHDEADGIACR